MVVDIMVVVMADMWLSQNQPSAIRAGQFPLTRPAITTTTRGTIMHGIQAAVISTITTEPGITIPTTVMRAGITVQIIPTPAGDGVTATSRRTTTIRPHAATTLLQAVSLPAEAAAAVAEAAQAARGRHVDADNT